MSKRLLAAGVVLLVLGLLAWRMLSPADPAGDTASDRTVAVELAPARTGALVEMRRFPGSLEAVAAYTVAPKIAGRVESVLVDIGDRVARGTELVRLDDGEQRQEVASARAELQVAQARRDEARSALRLAERRQERIRRLEGDGIAAVAELEDVDAEVAAQSAALAVAEAEIARARAALQAAELRLGYTRISADWSEAGGARVVGERLVDAGDTVAANTPLLSVLATDALKAVIQVPQAVFGSLEIGQGAAIHAPALAGRSVDAEVVRIAPRFDPASRQARVELRVPNADGALAPGMYVQVALRARSVEASAIVPVRALVERGGQRGVFTVDGERARFVPVEVLLEAGGEAALVPEGPAPRSVVVLGQDQLRDGAGVMPSGADAS